MKRKLIFGSLMGLLLVLTIGAGVASAQSNLSGKWILDKSQSTDTPPGLTKATMTITHKGTKVNVKQQLVMSTGPEDTNDVYVLDGSTQTLTLDGPNKSRAKGTRTAKAIAGGFESLDVGTFSPVGAPGKVTVKTSRKWTLADDGKSLILDITRASDLGTRQSHRVFTKG